MINIEELKTEIDEFMNDPGCVVPNTALDLINKFSTAIEQLEQRIASERARANLLQEALDEVESEEEM